MSLVKEDDRPHRPRPNELGEGEGAERTGKSADNGTPSGTCTISSYIILRGVGHTYICFT